eukprot:gene3844-20792_t
MSSPRGSTALTTYGLVIPMADFALLQQQANSQHSGSSGNSYSADALKHLPSKKKSRASTKSRGGGGDGGSAGGRPKARRSSYSYGEET